MPAPTTRFRELISRLTEAGVEFIVVGGVAAGALGAARVTLDLDVVYAGPRTTSTESSRH